MFKHSQKFFFSTSKTVYIVGGKRTPIGSFLGKLSKIKGPELASIAIKQALSSINLNASFVQEVILGNVCSAG
jgi:acetyl-CoA C-acetyltransferase